MKLKLSTAAKGIAGRRTGRARPGGPLVQAHSEGPCKPAVAPGTAHPDSWDSQLAWLLPTVYGRFGERGVKRLQYMFYRAGVERAALIKRSA